MSFIEEIRKITKQNKTNYDEACVKCLWQAIKISIRRAAQKGENFLLVDDIQSKYSEKTIDCLVNIIKDEGFEVHGFKNFYFTIFW